MKQDGGLKWYRRTEEPRARVTTLLPAVVAVPRAWMLDPVSGLGPHPSTFILIIQDGTKSCSPGLSSGTKGGIKKGKWWCVLLSFREASLEIPEALLSVMYEGLSLTLLQPHLKLLMFKASEELSLQPAVAHHDHGTNNADDLNAKWHHFVARQLAQRAALSSRCVSVLDVREVFRFSTLHPGTWSPSPS